MKIYHSSKECEPRGIPLGVALGNFDGVHLGHQVILKDLKKKCSRRGWIPTVFTFHPHPAKVLAPKSAPHLIQTTEQKLHGLEKWGVDTVILEPFNAQFAKQSPEVFFASVLLKRLAPKALWVGYDFTFGYRRKGNTTLLKQLCQEHDLELYVTQAQFQEATLVSSTQIRNLIGQGKVEWAQKLLGHPFALMGEVVKGHGIGGKKLGVHTANLAFENELLPKTGIYITGTRIPNGRQQGHASYWPSATSVGFNPTFPDKGFSVESHLIGFAGDLQGAKIEVEFLRWLRDEFTFPTAESLADQIKKDVAEAKAFHETLRAHR